MDIGSQLADTLDSVKSTFRRPKRGAIFSLHKLILLISTLVSWRLLMCVLNTEAPVVVVLSGSMEPAMFRGDMTALYTPSDGFQTGDIVVFNFGEREIPIIHRVVTKHIDHAGEVYYLTKGDNNRSNDRALYDDGQLWLKEDMIIGKSFAYFPNMGMITIWLNDYPLFRKCFILFILLTAWWSNE
eukprot:GHVH01004316.1.p1 GENE.GHVH01004316.1~~GHVH01004316.1.p1  ORF type:complete len:185 (+),score=26.17 GHVH01004316.1:67-621(+)